MLSTVVFSKNRAAQLDLLLQDLTLPATILYTYDPEFEAGYNKLIPIYPNFTFIKEDDFKKQTIELLKDEYILFLVDDDFQTEQFDIGCKEFEQFKNNPRKIISFSLRLCPAFANNIPFKEYNLWEWKKYWHSFGYPMSVSSTIFRKNDILPIMVEHDFNNPNELEITLRKYRQYKPYMGCCDTVKFANVLANQVQTQYKFKNMKTPLKELEEKFLSEQRISLKKMREKAKKADYCFLMENYEYE
jgi:hypothetical protein